MTQATQAQVGETRRRKKTNAFFESKARLLSSQEKSQEAINQTAANTYVMSACASCAASPVLKAHPPWKGEGSKKRKKQRRGERKQTPHSASVCYCVPSVPSVPAYASNPAIHPSIPRENHLPSRCPAKKKTKSRPSIVHAFIVVMLNDDNERARGEREAGKENKEKERKREKKTLPKLSPFVVWMPLAPDLGPAP